MNLSICIITKNEEQNIDRCLKALAPYGLETIVVDTGSTDRTKQIAARYTDRLYDFPWCDDFSAAKNFAIEKASHSYVLVLDSDEFVEQLDLSALEKQIVAHPGAVGRIRRRNVFHRNGEEQENREWINRIFAKEYFHYEGRIHEQVTPLRGAESGYRTYETPVVILHTGYDLPEQQKKEKAERNIRLLEQELKQLGWDGNAGAKDGVAKAETAGTDEYDTPLQEAYFNSFWDEMVSFVGAFFNNSFKTNPSLGRALLTGITRICKESIFSDLNNIDVVTQTSTKYETAFGFTEEEVKVGLARVGLLDYREKVKEWYDGFTFGQRRDMYNPWSITKFIDAEGIFDTYWANTSNNKLVSSLIRKSSKNMKMAMEQLLEGEMLHVEMDEQLDFAQLEYRESAIFSLLYATGYLRVNQKNDQEYVLMLTNKEVEIMFRRIIREWFNDMDTGYGDFRRALLHDNIEEMNYYMNMVTLSTFSYFDTGTGRGNIDETERFYHGFVLGLLADLSDQFSIRSNRESGLGRYDIILRAREENGNSYIMEFKVFDRERDENMKACVARALQQIEEKQYETELVADGIARERIRKYGFAFDGKKVLIGS